VWGGTFRLWDKYDLWDIQRPSFFFFRNSIIVLTGLILKTDDVTNLGVKYVHLSVLILSGML